MTDIVKVMQDKGAGVKEQVYPQTHADAILNLDKYLNQNVTSGVASVNGKKGAVVLTAADVNAWDKSTPLPAGPKGPKGDTGATGPKGATGATGPAGKNGTNATTTAIATATTNGLMSAADKKALDAMTKFTFEKVGEIV